MNFEIFLIQCLNSIQYGLLLFLIAAGLSLIFGIMGIINLAHGSFYMIGAYLAYILTPFFSQILDSDAGFVLTLITGTLLCIIFGYFLEWCFFSFLYKRDHLQQILMTYGLILIIEELRSILTDDDVHSVAIPDFLSGNIPLSDVMSYPFYRLFISLVCIMLALIIRLLLTKTRIGLRIRAGNSNREMVEVLGVNIQILYRIVFAFGVGIAALAGILAAPISSIYPAMGDQILIICFVVVVIGGIGSIKGAMIAALLIGFVDTFGQVLLPQYASVLIYLSMAFILLVKPDGLQRHV